MSRYHCFCHFARVHYVIIKASHDGCWGLYQSKAGWPGVKSQQQYFQSPVSVNNSRESASRGSPLFAHQQQPRSLLLLHSTTHTKKKKKKNPAHSPIPNTKRHTTPSGGNPLFAQKQQPRTLFKNDPTTKKKKKKKKKTLHTRPSQIPNGTQTQSPACQPDSSWELGCRSLGGGTWRHHVAQQSEHRRNAAAQV